MLTFRNLSFPEVGWVEVNWDLRMLGSSEPRPFVDEDSSEGKRPKVKRKLFRVPVASFIGKAWVFFARYLLSLRFFLTLVLENYHQGFEALL